MPRLRTSSTRPHALVAILEEDRDAKDTWNGEERDAIWAPKMEAVLTTRFSQLLNKFGFKQTKLKIDCRASSCYLSFNFDKDDLFRAQDLGERNPQMVMVKETGAWAEVMYEIPVEGKPVVFPDIFVGADSDGTFTKSMILAFGEEEIDPENYSSWAAKQPDELRRAQARAEEEARQAEKR